MTGPTSSASRHMPIHDHEKIPATKESFMSAFTRTTYGRLILATFALVAFPGCGGEKPAKAREEDHGHTH